MKEICPRCESHAVKQMHAGLEDGSVLWRVWHCGACAFTWRDSEPMARPAWAQLKDVDLGRLRHILPPVGKPT